MDYVPRQGVVCVNICGRHLLIPTRKVSAVCNTALPLSGSAFVVWSAIEKDMSFEKVQYFFKSGPGRTDQTD